MGIPINDRKQFNNNKCQSVEPQQTSHKKCLIEGVTIIASLNVYPVV